MEKTLVLAPALAGLFVVLTSTAQAQFADSVVSYNAGSGIAGGYQNPNVALGAPTVVPDAFSGVVTPFNAPWQGSDIVGLGTGGSLTLQFNRPIENDPSHPYGLDFIIFGHAGLNDADYPNGLSDGTFYTSGDATMRISVSADGSTFYPLNSLYTPLVDNLFPTDSSGSPFIPVNPALTLADFNGKNLAQIRSLYNGSDGGAGFDLSWAIDNNNQSVSLASVNFVRLEDLSGAAYIDAVSAVPEPSVLALALVSGAGLLACTRRTNT